MNEELGEVAASTRLAELGITLPAVPAPVAAYLPAVVSAGQVFTAGQLPFVDGALLETGKVGATVTPERAAELARVAALNAVAAAASVVGGVDGIRRVVKLVVFVASAPSFTGQPQVANGASELLQQVFGQRGLHARSAVGVAVLPLDSPIEVELVVEASAASF
ncbi:MAG TPA: RidA family protein [Propionicimonas sp.]|jgi:enamine deaminase RidA (YjgF/YER057c/UK114 family)|uniref:RidA family protein n=1 Tax=Propionicimonas sp. TaxID=1955623 RepID=UPI002F42DCDD